MNYGLPKDAKEAVKLIRLAAEQGDADAVWDLHFEMKMVGGKPIGEDVRVAGVFRMTEDGWRFIYYAESPKTAKVYIEELFQKDVRDDWDEFYKEAKKKKNAVMKTY